MFGLGWSEMVLIGIVALIVIGPKDLPGMFHTLGKVMAKVRAMGRDFQRAMNDAARESGMDDVSKDLRNIANPRKMGMDAVKDAASKFESWDPLKDAKSSDKPAPGPHTQKLSKERAEAAEKMREAAAKKAQARIDAEMEALQAGQEAPKTPATEEVAEAAAKPAAKKKAPAKKPAAKKTAAKKTAASKSTTTKKTASKTPAKKAAPRKTAAKKTPATKADE